MRLGFSRRGPLQPFADSPTSLCSHGKKFEVTMVGLAVRHAPLSV